MADAYDVAARQQAEEDGTGSVIDNLAFSLCFLSSPSSNIFLLALLLRCGYIFITFSFAFLARAALTD